MLKSNSPKEFLSTGQMADLCSVTPDTLDFGTVADETAVPRRKIDGYDKARQQKTPEYGNRVHRLRSGGFIKSPLHQPPQ